MRNTSDSKSAGTVARQNVRLIPLAGTGRRVTKIERREVSYTMDSDPSKIMESIEEDPSEDPYESPARTPSVLPAGSGVGGTTQGRVQLDFPQTSRHDRVCMSLNQGSPVYVMGYTPREDKRQARRRQMGSKDKRVPL
ncbi:hypothetical protein K7X08_010446 [Anisodus acutangulus]|uniref:Uncharacterized protein n=1 Tax=Anisodus acutangulus TaxID=402998 RepID=A0A9Q1RRR1_9SOLA|nr:hypothetical protein K7X08_010446 [Anisodus acutangulus]